LLAKRIQKRKEQGGKMATAIMNHAMTAAQALTSNAATPMAAASSSSSSSSSSASTISANDFLTLLVTEMKNQDPTANTDPNEYINQLVNVNSLEQLISINQTLTTDSKTTATGGATGGTATASTAAPSGESGAQPQATGAAGAIGAATAKLAPGNLSVPAGSSAAERVAQSLNGKLHAQ
jgi:flagellar basal-body rod modification protein FlgD